MKDIISLWMIIKSKRTYIWDHKWDQDCQICFLQITNITQKGYHNLIILKKRRIIRTSIVIKTQTTKLNKLENSH